MPIIGQISVGDGATFTPAVDNDGVISWSNNKNLPNPASVDIPQTVMDRYLIAPIASPAFTGNPTAPTQAKTDNSTKLATTAYVKAVVADYLALTGGSITGDVDITGDLSVSGAITGNVTGNLTGNADTATNATNDANGNPIAGTYLPFAGGTMTGSIQYVNNGKVFAIGNTTTGNVDLGWSWDNREGAGLGLRSTDFSNPGEFTLFARDSANSCSLLGKPDGSLTWDNKDVERVNASGTNYIRYESGLQMVFNTINMSGATTYTKTYTYPVAFVGDVTIVTGNRWAANNEQISIQNDSTTKFDAYITNAGTNSHNIFFISIGRWK